VAVRTPGLSGVLLPAVKDANTLHEALGLGYRQILLERGNLLSMVGALAAASRSGVAIFVNLDGVEGLTLDTSALAFLATDLSFSGVISTKPHILRDASRFRLRTIQRIHALDSVGLETGLNSLASPAPQAIAVAPGLAVPHVLERIRRVTSASIWGTGFIRTAEQARRVLAQGAEVVSSARPEVWKEFQPALV
jgi:glycerol uptake operon antiterminator